MRRLVALLVGIDAYLPPVNALYGCRNDIAALERYLQGRTTGATLDLRVLLDAEATRDAVVAAFREHLGSAGPEDVALFAYAGHGSEEPAPLEVAHLEPTARIQTLMFYDCGRRIAGRLRRGLADKELALLIAEVAAKGPHVVLVLDCCHSGGATRDEMVRVRGWTPDPPTAPAEVRDLVTELTAPRPLQEFLPGTMEHWTAPAAPHVVLSACRSFEKAKELPHDGLPHGAFSIGLVEALTALGPAATYRSVLTAARANVERIADEQVPELYPLDRGGAGDATFLDGHVTSRPTSFTMTQGRDGWEIDGGAVHGLTPPCGDEAYVLACTPPREPTEIAGLARVSAVDLGRSRVEPIDWQPEAALYHAAVADVPLPPATVTFDLPGADIAARAVDDVVDRVRRAVSTSGPGGTPSPFLVIGAAAPPATAAHLRVAVPVVGVARIARGDGTALTADTAVLDDDGARTVAARLEHIARWEQVRSLGGQPSALDGAVRLDVFAAVGGDTFRPSDRAPLATAAGGYALTYEQGADGPPVPPQVFIEIVNTSTEALWVAVLNLTDRFRCHPVLPTVALAAGHTHSLWDGSAIPVALPAGRPVVAGATGRDWLKLIVSDGEFDATAFDLPALDEPPPARPATRSSRPTGVLERLAARAVYRATPDGTPATVARWATSSVVVETTVPATGAGGT